MQTTKDTLSQYYNSAENFLQAWSQYMDAAIPNDPGNIIMKAALKDYTRKLESALEKSEEYAMKQPDPSTLDPQQIREENVKRLDEFQKVYQKITQTITADIASEREHMQTDEYLTEIQENRQYAGYVANVGLTNATKTLDTMSKLLSSATVSVE